MRGRESVDDLYEPTLAGVVERPVGVDPPWRLGSQGYVAFFGGPLAAGVVGFLNARRLELEGVRLYAALGIGLAGFLAVVLLAVLVERIGSSGRLLLVAAGLACYVPIRYLQSRADRRYRARAGGDEAYASLWGAGLAIVLVCGFATALVVGAVA